MRRLRAWLAVVLLSAGACTGATATPSITSSPPLAATTAPATPTPPPSAEAAPTATPAPTPGYPATGVTIVNESTSQFELWSPGGVRVFVDIAYPDVITSPPAATDILLTTHLHEDHVYQPFVDAFPGVQLFNRAGSVKSGDVSVVGINAAHNEGDLMTDAGATDHIFVVDIGGIRVVVFGDLGQRELTAAQLQAVGDVDVAISQLDNLVSMASISNGIVTSQMAQIKPAILIPTHIGNLDEAKAAAKLWPGMATELHVVVTRPRVPSQLTLLFMGDLAPAYRKILGVPSCDWQ